MLLKKCTPPDIKHSPGKSRRQSWATQHRSACTFCHSCPEGVCNSVQHGAAESGQWSQKQQCWYIHWGKAAGKAGHSASKRSHLPSGQWSSDTAMMERNIWEERIPVSTLEDTYKMAYDSNMLLESGVLLSARHQPTLAASGLSCTSADGSLPPGITSRKLSLAMPGNFASAVRVRPIVRFWQLDGCSNSPGS